MDNIDWSDAYNVIVVFSQQKLRLDLSQSSQKLSKNFFLIFFHFFHIWLEHFFISRNIFKLNSLDKNDRTIDIGGAIMWQGALS